MLVALGVDGLGEVALAVEQPDADERQAHVARGLAVVAGEDAQAARVDRKALVEAELGAEVGDQVGGAQPLRAVAAQRLVVIGVVGRQHAVEVAQEHRVVGRIHQHLLVHASQERLGVVSHRIPQAGVQAREQRARRPVPAVPKVRGQLFEPRQACRDLRIDFELIDGARLHREQVCCGGATDGARPDYATLEARSYQTAAGVLGSAG